MGRTPLRRGLDGLDRGGAGREDRHRERLEGDGRRRPELHHYYGSGANYNLGQNNNANYPWPRVNVNDYRRAIDFTSRRRCATGHVCGPSPVVAPRARAVHAEHSTKETRPGRSSSRSGSRRGASSRARSQQRDGGADRRRPAIHVVTWMRPMKSPGGQPYRVVGYINPANLVERVETWLENPVFGDMLVRVGVLRLSRQQRAEVSERDRPEARRLADVRGADPGREREPANLQALMTPPAAAGRRGRSGGGGGRRCRPAGPRPRSSPNGVYRINGAYIALAVEFADHIVLFEPGRRTRRARRRSSPRRRR